MVIINLMSDDHHKLIRQVKTFPSLLSSLGVGESFLLASAITILTTLWGVSNERKRTEGEKDR